MTCCAMEICSNKRYLSALIVRDVFSVYKRTVPASLYAMSQLWADKSYTRLLTQVFGDGIRGFNGCPSVYWDKVTPTNILTKVMVCCLRRFEVPWWCSISTCRGGDIFGESGESGARLCFSSRLSQVHWWHCGEDFICEWCIVLKKN